MNLKDFLPKEGEQPLDRIVTGGGFCGIFRTIACIGDSLSSGEFESMINGKVGYHDYYDYSWGQFLARDAGCKVYNFSRGGMSAREYCESFAESQGFWSPELASQAYIIAMGVNDVSSVMNGGIEFGSLADVDPEDYHNNKHTVVGYYAQIIQRYKLIQSKAKFFLMTMPRGGEAKDRIFWSDEHAKVLYQLAELFENCYVLDFRKYAPVYDQEFRKVFFLANHMNAAGYRLTAWMVESYIDYIIRNHMDDFKQIGFVGTPYYHEDEKGLS